jgi:hypothetical protein
MEYTWHIPTIYLIGVPDEGGPQRQTWARHAGGLPLAIQLPHEIEEANLNLKPEEPGPGPDSESKLVWCASGLQVRDD